MPFGVEKKGLVMKNRFWVFCLMASVFRLSLLADAEPFEPAGEPSMASSPFIVDSLALGASIRVLTRAADDIFIKEQVWDADAPEGAGAREALVRSFGLWLIREAQSLPRLFASSASSRGVSLRDVLFEVRKVFEASMKDLNLWRFAPPVSGLEASRLQSAQRATLSLISLYLLIGQNLGMPKRQLRQMGLGGLGLGLVWMLILASPTSSQSASSGELMAASSIGGLSLIYSLVCAWMQRFRPHLARYWVLSNIQRIDGWRVARTWKKELKRRFWEFVTQEQIQLFEKPSSMTAQAFNEIADEDLLKTLLQKIADFSGVPFYLLISGLMANSRPSIETPRKCRDLVGSVGVFSIGY